MHTLARVQKEQTHSRDVTNMSLLSEYKPVFETNGKDWALKAEMIFHEHLCYHEGKVHGGILALLLDHMFADCCASMDSSRRAVTADLHLSYVRSVSPKIPTCLELSVLSIKS